jgi:hypothetical protein
MQGQTKERWRELCKEAAIEQDPEKLRILVKEIIQLLDEKTERLKGKPAGTPAA